MNIFDVIDPSEREHCREIMGQVTGGSRVEKVESVFISKHGKRIIVEGNISCRFLDGKPVSTRGIFRDVTKRKMAERDLAERARLASFTADVGVALTKGETLEAKLQQCAVAMIHHLEGSLASIWVADSTCDTLELKASAKSRPLHFQSLSRIPIGKYRLGRVAEQSFEGIVIPCRIFTVNFMLFRDRELLMAFQK